MGSLDVENLPDQALLLVDSAPVIYFLEGHPKFGPYFQPLFEIHAAGRVRFAVTTITVCEVLTGPLKSNDEATARRYRSVLDSWQLVGRCRSGRKRASDKCGRSCHPRSRFLARKIATRHLVIFTLLQARSGDGRVGI